MSGRYELVTQIFDKTYGHPPVRRVEASDDDRRPLRELRRGLGGTFETMHHRYVRTIIDTHTGAAVR